MNDFNEVIIVCLVAMLVFLFLIKPEIQDNCNTKLIDQIINLE